MRGLLEKDICLLLKRKKFFLILFAVLIWSGVVLDNAFFISYAPLISILLASTTINQDDDNNAMAFLMTLPCSARDYAKEKYCVTICINVLVGVLVVVSKLLISLFRGTGGQMSDCLILGIATIPVGMILSALILPFELKFGYSKGQVAIFAFYGALLATTLFGAQVLNKLGADVNDIVKFISETPIWLLGIIILVFAALALFVSVRISMKIMDNKEY